MKIDTRQMMRKSVALALLLAATYGGQALAQDDTVIYGSVVSSMNWGAVGFRRPHHRQVLLGFDEVWLHAGALRGEHAERSAHALPTVHWNGGDNRPLHSAARRQGCTCKGERPEGKFQQLQHHRKGQLHHAFRDKGRRDAERQH